MFKIKHFMDAYEADDGKRLWIEPINLTRDLTDWCAVDHVLSQFGPPKAIWKWFDKHPDGYEEFRARYHEHLSKSAHREAMIELTRASRNENFTLLHQGDDDQHNTATALYEFLSELSAYCPPD